MIPLKNILRRSSRSAVDKFLVVSLFKLKASYTKPRDRKRLLQASQSSYNLQTFSFEE